MKKTLLPLLVLLLVLTAAWAAADQLTVTTEPGRFTYDFTLPGERFAMVRYNTAEEDGWFIVSAEDGHFTGSAELKCSYSGGNLTVKTLRTNTRTVDTVRVRQPGTPMPAGEPAAFEFPLKAVRDLTLTPVDGGVRYDFTATGCGSVWLKYVTSQQRGKVLIYPEDGWHYSGVLTLPCTFNQSNVYITLISGRQNKQLATGKTTRGYVLTQRVTESAPEGRLKGVIVCIDAGHSNAKSGGKEPMGPGLPGMSSGKGGMAEGSYTNRRESVVMLEIAYVLRDELLRQGATVVMTRESEDEWYTNIERDDVANNAGAHVMLRLHGDNVSDKNSRGFSVFYPWHSEYAQAVADETEYGVYGQLLLDGLLGKASYGGKVRTRLVATDSYVGNNWAKMPCFLIELGYMSNVQDDILLSTPGHQQDLAEGLADGIWQLMLRRGVISR